MKFLCENRNVELIIPDEILTQVEKFGIEHLPNEYGGFFIGKYSNNMKQLDISEIVLPKKYKGFPTLFERSTDELEELLEKIFTESKQYYVGEWHTHPNGCSIYSYTDLNAMIEIANSKDVNIKNPILMILSVTENSLFEFSIYLYDEERLYKYEQY